VVATEAGSRGLLQWVVGLKFEERRVASNVTELILGGQPVFRAVSMRLSVCEHISETTRPLFTNFLCMLLTIVARSSAGCDTLYTSDFMDSVMFARNDHGNRRRVKGVYSK